MDLPDRDPDVRIAIWHSIRVLSGWTVVLFLSVLLVFGLGLVNAARQRAELQRIQDETTNALCTFRADLQRRYDDGVEFLVNHPEGIPGISAADIRRSLSNQRATLISLRDLPCEDPNEL